MGLLKRLRSATLVLVVYFVQSIWLLTQFGAMPKASVHSSGFRRRARAEGRSQAQYYGRRSGLLPYMLSSEKGTSGISIRTTSFEHEGRAYRIAVSAASVWQSSSEPDRIEYLAYLRPADHQHCSLDAGNHCQFGEELFPVTICSVHGRSRAGYFKYNPREQPCWNSIVRIFCPLYLDEPSSWDSTVDVSLTFGNGSALQIILERKLPTRTNKLAVCTQPFFGLAKHARFWYGNPVFEGYSLMDAFLIYHAGLLGLHVTVNDATFEFGAAVSKYLGPLVQYSTSWILPSMGAINNPAYDYEILAEATCTWERRLDSAWVIILHAADNFLMPMDGRTVLESLASLNETKYSGAHVPTVQGWCSENCGLQVPLLQRWDTLGPELEFGNGRHTPLLNPRHVTHACVHWNNGRLPTFKENMEPKDVVEILKLHTVHLMAMTREGMNRRSGRIDTVYRHWGERLARVCGDVTAAAMNISLGLHVQG